MSGKTYRGHHQQSQPLLNFTDEDSGADSDVPGSMTEQKKMYDAHARSLIYRIDQNEYHNKYQPPTAFSVSPKNITDSPANFASINQQPKPPITQQTSNNPRYSLANESKNSSANLAPSQNNKKKNSITQQHKRSKSDGGTQSFKQLKAQHIINEQNNTEEEGCLVFCETVSQKLICMLCCNVFKDPIITSCGHTFCQQCVSGKSAVCPVDGSKLVQVVVNLAVREQVGELYIHCKYGCTSSAIPGEFEVNRNGCPLTIKLAERNDHEEQCMYAPVKCPNSSLCRSLIKMELKDHVAQCQQARCPHSKYNCRFEGTCDELTEHLKTCRFEAMKDFLEHTERQMKEMRELVSQKDQEAEFMRGMFSKITERIERLEKAVEIRIDLLDENLTKLSSDFIETRRCLGHIEKEISSMDSRTFNIGAFDVQAVLKCKGTFVGHHGPVWSLCVFSSLLFSGSSDNSIKIWDTRSNYTCIKTFSEHSGMVLTLCAYRGKLYSGSADCTISVFDIENLKLIQNFAADENPICTLAVGNGMLFSGSLKSIKVWNLDTLKCAQTLGGLNHWIRALCTTENFLYCGSYQTIKIWDLKTLEQVRVIQTQGGSVYSMVVSREYIICGTYENCIHIWDVKNYNSVARLTGHVGTVYDLVLMTLVDATRVISASYDGSLRVWSLDNLQCVQTLFRHQGSVTALAVCRGRLFSGSVDSTVKVWL